MGSQGQRHTNFLRTVQERDAVPVGMIQFAQRWLGKTEQLVFVALSGHHPFFPWIFATQSQKRLDFEPPESAYCWRYGWCYCVSAFLLLIMRGAPSHTIPQRKCLMQVSLASSKARLPTPSVHTWNSILSHRWCKTCLYRSSVKKLLQTKSYLPDLQGFIDFEVVDIHLGDTRRGSKVTTFPQSVQTHSLPVKQPTVSCFSSSAAKATTMAARIAKMALGHFNSSIRDEVRSLSDWENQWCQTPACF